MKALRIWVLATIGCAWQCGAAVELLPHSIEERPRVFAGESRRIPLLWRNSGTEKASVNFRARLYQTSSSTAVILKEQFWKKLELLPGQTVLETAMLDFPPVNAESKFLIQWLSETNQVLGMSEVIVYSTNLLGQLRHCVGEESLGILDPENELKPALRQNEVGFLDLEDGSLSDFQGKLVIAGPFRSLTRQPEGLAQSIRQMAARGVSVVWMQPPADFREPIKPSFCVAMSGKAAIVLAQNEIALNQSEDPRSQSNLMQLCRLALNPASAGPAFPTEQP